MSKKNYEILVLCDGNTCRSVMAEGLLRHYFEQLGRRDVVITSAGMDAVEGQPADPHAIEVMSQRGIDITGHRSRRADAAIASKADLILVADSNGYTRALREGYAGPDINTLKAHMLAGYSTYHSGKAYNIEPISSKPLEAYEAAAAKIESSLTGFDDHFRHEHPVITPPAELRPAIVVNSVTFFPHAAFISPEPEPTRRIEEAPRHETVRAPSRLQLTLSGASAAISRVLRRGENKAEK